MISVVIPTHNNAERILDAIENVHAAMQEKYEIIIVDDYSTDSTWERAMEAGGKRPIRVICWNDHKGKSYATWRGIKDAHGDVIAVLHDLEISSAAIKEMVDEVRKGCDIFGYIVREPTDLFERAASALARIPYAWSPAFAVAARSLDGVSLFKRFSHRFLEILVKSKMASRKTVVLAGSVPASYKRTLAYSLLSLMPWSADVFLQELQK